VARAEQGIYGRNAFRGESLAFRDRHFTDTPQGYSVVPRVRAHVHFQAGNLLDPGLPLPTDAYDIVFCRNLLIYFDHPTQEAAVAVLRRLCRRDGVIFVGPAEASLLTRLGMKQVDATRAFAFHNAAAKAAYADTPRPRQAAGTARAAPWRAAHVSTGPRARPSTGSTPPARQPAAQNGRPTGSRHGAAASAGMPADRSSAHAAAANAPASLQAIQALADAGRLDEARAAAAAHVSTHGASAQAYYLIGLLDDAANLPATAEAAYRKTLYLDPGHRQALLHLASLLETRGESASAGQLRARAARSEKRHA
jgi:chemotaxis protein methyltransferase WspC